MCDTADCTIDGPLHNNDSGLYFCEIYDSLGKKDYYVNVTVLGKTLSLRDGSRKNV